MNNIAGYCQIPERLLIILKRLADGGFLVNNRQWIVSVGWLRDPWLFQVVRSMNNLEKLNLLGCNLTLADVPQLFRSCPKLAELHLMLVENRKVEMGEKLKNELRPGFQRLRHFEFDWDMNPRQIIQEILT
jgi:hypothetical protein